jgi:uncharacterized C2H2 Zn-finger protein
MVGYKCKRCHKIFNMKGDYTRHINRKFLCKPVIVEKNDNQFKCKECNNSYSQKTNLYRHIRNKHKNNDNNNDKSNNNIINNVDNTTSDANIIQQNALSISASENITPDTNVKIDSIKNMTVNLYDSDGKKIHKCQYCNFEFTLKSSLNKHLNGRFDTLPLLK